MGDKDKQQFVDFFSSLNRMPLTRMNSVTLLTDGQEKLDSLLQDLKAKHSIHIEYYAFVTDNIGQQVLHVLEEKPQKAWKFEYYMMHLALMAQKQKISIV